ncbi:type VII toxin-antitoxin system HepT family RNase toxin [Blastococcus saxobsidens]|uniref:DUF86 domain-containing protein n=1 Tax=Blastococcus saxobsidens (strain DD2) TaxID=1146883 RepID=H6RLS6_BLASD|nr:DUF86 domain-containing protein [Blastococcus saxobsidens]CCG05005.1 conserved protein of unknown function [Blastococcus saxobsidens DD2]
MVDETRVSRLLLALSEELGFLAEEAAAPVARQQDRAVRRGVKYALATAVEACVDIAHHVCASEGWGPLNNNAHSMLVLSRHGVLSADLAGRMSRAVGFRNVLVHEYIEVDEELVTARLADHGDLHEFAAAVAEFVTRSAER